VALVQAEVPGTHSPPHVPLSRQAKGHVVAFPHCPAFEHTRLCVFEEHCAAPGTHTPPQVPPTHANVQVVAAPHSEFCPQVWTVVVDAHWVATDLQLPVHKPAVHVAVHGPPSAIQAAASLHCCGCSPLQRRAPGVHSPAQAFPAQMKGQRSPAPH
jgi:hypothetical protein